jgi:Tol biopolymer transport system component
MKYILRISISMVIVILVSCSPAQNSIPATVLSTQTLASTVTPLPATDTPQPTGLPSATLLPLAANGPWGLVEIDNGIWAFNTDGESLRQLTQDNIGSVAISPSGGKLAYLADINPDDPNLEKISLRLLSLPDGTIQTISDVMVPLASMVIPTPGSSSGSPTPDLVNAEADIYSAVGSMDWSPDGQRLAFVSGHDGLFANVYVYDLSTGKITRMTDRPHYDYGVKWSPTGEYIFFSEADSMGRGAGISGGSAWVMRADHPESAPVWGIPASDTTPGISIINWISPDTLLLEYYAQPCGINQLSHVDVVTGKTQTLWQAAEWGDCVEHIMRDPVSGDLLLNQTIINQPPTDYHIDLLSSNGVKLKDVNTGDLRTYLLRGSYPDALNLVGSAAAVSASLPETLIPIQSPDGRLWAWLPWPTWPLTKGDGLWIGNAGQPPKQISSATVESFSWSPDSKTMFFYASDNLYIAHWPDLKPEVFNPALISTRFGPYTLNVNWVIH